METINKSKFSLVPAEPDRFWSIYGQLKLVFFLPLVSKVMLYLLLFNEVITYYVKLNFCRKGWGFFLIPSASNLWIQMLGTHAFFSGGNGWAHGGGILGLNGLHLWQFYFNELCNTLAHRLWRCGQPAAEELPFPASFTTVCRPWWYQDFLSNHRPQSSMGNFLKPNWTFSSVFFSKAAIVQEEWSAPCQQL